MPKGIYYTKEFRSLIYINHVQNDETPNFIMARCLSDHPNNQISLKNLKSICNRLSHDPGFAGDYLLGAKTYGKS